MTSSSEGRYHTIDSLRGVAALSVVLFHLYGAIRDDVVEWVPVIIDRLFSFGFVGVPVFFVLSGFVISLSIGRSKVTLKYIANFAFRRSLRLDPPYWIAIFLALSLLIFKANYIDVNTVIPTIGNVFSHMFYLQDILAYEPKISVVYWTLCLEIQFYLVFVISIAISQASLIKQKYSEIAHLLLILILGFLSVFIDQDVLGLKLNGFFLQYWHYFLIGVLAHLGIKRGGKYRVIFILWLCFELGLLGILNMKSYIVAALLTGGFIFFAGLRGKLSVYLNNMVLQFLGKISYSLYLLHADIGWKTISVGKVLLGNEISFVESCFLFVTGLGVSVLGAFLLYYYVERPFVKLSQRFKLDKTHSQYVPSTAV